MRDGKLGLEFLGMVRASFRRCRSMYSVRHLFILASIPTCFILSFLLLEAANIDLQDHLRIDIKSDASTLVRQQLLTTLRALPGVIDVSYITREQALLEQRTTDPQFSALLETAGLPNPFSDAFLVTASSFDARARISTLLRQPQYSSALDANTLAAVGAAREESTAQISIVFHAFTPTLRILLGVGFLLSIMTLCAKHSLRMSHVLLTYFGALPSRSMLIRWCDGCLVTTCVIVLAFLLSTLVSIALIQTLGVHLMTLHGSTSIFALLLLSVIMIPLLIAAMFPVQQRYTSSLLA